MENDVITRIKQILDAYNLSETEFASILRIPQTTVNSWLTQRRKPQTAFIDAILETYPEISAEWLLRGVGNMKVKATNSNTDNGKGKGNTNHSNSSSSKVKRISARLVAAILRGCPDIAEQDRLIKELDGFLSESAQN